MNIKRIVCGPLEANCYIVYRQDGGVAYIIDPGYDVKQTQDFVKAHSLKVKAILLTHTHRDHSGKADALAEYFGVEVCAHREELDYFEGNINRLFGSNVNRLFDGDEILDIDGEALSVLHTPGHSAGGLCFYSDKSRVAFTGDTIFNVDLGYTHFAGGSAARLKESLINVVNQWANDVTIYPGHGDPATMKSVREVNREFLDMVAESAK